MQLEGISSTLGAADPNKSSGAAVGGIHPDARAGGGGAGYFRDANTILGDDALAGTVRHAKSPSSRLWIGQTATGTASAGTQAAAKNPPKTKTLTKKLASESSAEMNFDVRVRVLRDRRNDRRIQADTGKTWIMPSSGLRSIAGMTWSTSSEGKVTRVVSKLVVRGIYEIETSYGHKAKPTDPSRYGRGTTAGDKAAGDVSLGFHESCHREEYLDYLVNTPFPKFGGKIGMTEVDFEAAEAQFRTDFEAFSQGLLNLGDGVDEVGYKKSKCIADGKC